MGLNYRSELTIRVAEDANFTAKVLFDRRLIASSTTHAEQSSGFMKVAQADGTKTVPMGTVAAGKVLYVEADKDLNVTVDGELIMLRPAGATSAKLFLENATFAAVTVTATAVGTTAQIVYCILGDA